MRRLTNLIARPIDQEEACAIATRFYYTKKLGKDIHKLKSLHALDLIYSPQHANDVCLTPPEYYIFSPENRKGFIIVAGDDLAKQIVFGYSLDAPISYRLPNSIQGYLNCYTETSLPYAAVKHLLKPSAKQSLRHPSSLHNGVNTRHTTIIAHHLKRRSLYQMRHYCSCSNHEVLCLAQTNWAYHL